MTTPRAIVFTERGILSLAKPPGLRASDALLLWHLVKILPIAGEMLNLTLLADELGLARPTVTVGMQTLLKAGFVIRGAKVGRVYTYKLNSAYFHHL
jgi:predicted transcriptional regulator